MVSDQPDELSANALTVSTKSRSGEVPNNGANLFKLTRENNFIGYLSGSSNILGKKNCFFGFESGVENIEGFGNVFLGANAGRNAMGNSNVFIGNFAGLEQQGSDMLMIENSPRDSTGSLIWGNFNTDQLRMPASRSLDYIL